MAKGVKHILTDKERDWLRVHFRNTKNAELAARLGISESALHRYAREMGLTKTAAFVRKTQRNAADLAKASHLRNGTYPPKGYIIPKSEQYRFKPGETPEQRIGKRRNRQRIEKSAASRRETFRQERARVTFGLEQKTKLAVRRQPRRTVCQRNYLRRRGYLIARGSMVAYYGPGTRRSEAFESRTRTSCPTYVGFLFLPLP